MSVNSSSSSNASLSPYSPSSHPSVSVYSFLQICFQSKAVAFSLTAFNITSIPILLPLCIFVLYLGIQRWRRQRSGTTMTHSSVFTCHMVVIELMNMLGSTLVSCAIHTYLPHMMMVGFYLCSINLSGQMLFHMLTCVERYLAVIHPITYLSLRKAKGIRIRNIAIGCVWLLCFTTLGLMNVDNQLLTTIIAICIISFTLTVVSFCSLSVLCVLIRPGPGEGGGDRQRVHQSKLRAFYTIMAILGVLLVRLGAYLLITSMYALTMLVDADKCVVWTSAVWFGLPSSLVLPLLFLHRAGKLPCCTNNNTLGQGSD